jgi:uncharacterized membrane protein YeaQ/YmgE (transglycosylase-associated protein family)
VEILLLVLLAVVLMLLLGVAVVGVAFELLWWALVGLGIGALARLVLPGKRPIGWLATIGAGIAGALLGGIVADVLDWGAVPQFLLSVAAAAGVIVFFTRRRGAYV